MISYGVLLLIGCSVATAFNPTLNGKIVGGKDADIKDFPHQVSYRYGGGHICGGSIISKDFVLTAAHCTINKSSRYMTFYAGSTNRYGSGGSEHQAIKVYQHPDYNSTNYDWDFSLIRVSPPFPIGSTNIQTISLTSKEPENKSKVVVTGWGALFSGGPSPDILQKVEVTMMSRDECRNDYGQSQIRVSMICAADEGKDSCQGDSGGPLITVRGNVRTQVGVVSWGYGCADPQYPGVYSNIAAARNWIYDVANV